MVKGMTYPEGVEHMKWLYETYGSGDFIAYESANNIIAIHYPGKKENKEEKRCDYQLSLKDKNVPTHKSVCTWLNSLVKKENITFEEIDELLEHTYRYGTKILFQNESLVPYQHLIFWITLQEEINYPREKKKAGINLAYCRFFEAICCTKSNSLTLEVVRKRCNNNGQPKPPLV